jgi:ribose transport system permease protein
MSASAQSTEGPEARIRAAQRWLADRPVVVLAAILLLLMLLTNSVSPGFFAPKSLSTTVTLAAIYGIIAAGQTLVIFTGGIDLSIANTASAGGYIMATYALHHNTVSAVAVGLAVGLVVGLVNGIGVGVFRVQPLIMTLGVGTIVLGGLTVYSLTFNGGPVVPGAIQTLGAGTALKYVPVSLLALWLPITVLLVWVLPRSGLGRSIYAVGDNPEACRLAGVRVWQVLIATYTMCGLLAALAGITLAGITNAVDVSMASLYLLPSVAAVVIGGTSLFGGSGTYWGTVFGALILTVLDSFLTNVNASEAERRILYGAIILTLATIYSRGFSTE